MRDEGRGTSGNSSSSLVPHPSGALATELRAGVALVGFLPGCVDEAAVFGGGHRVGDLVIVLLQLAKDDTADDVVDLLDRPRVAAQVALGEAGGRLVAEGERGR